MAKLEAGKAQPNARPGLEILLLLPIANPRFRRALPNPPLVFGKSEKQRGVRRADIKRGAVSWGTERQRAGRRVKSRQERDADAVKGGPPLRVLSNEAESGGWHVSLIGGEPNGLPRIPSAPQRAL